MSFSSCLESYCDGNTFHLLILRLWEGRGISSCVHMVTPEVTPGEQNKTKNEHKYNTKSPQTQDLKSGKTSVNNNPIRGPARTSAIKAAAMKGKHRRLAHTLWVVNRQNATQPNAAQTPQQGHRVRGRLKKPWNPFLYYPISVPNREMTARAQKSRVPMSVSP